MTTPRTFPLVYRWPEPLPLRRIQATGPRRPALWHQLPTAASGQPTAQTFDFGVHVHRLMIDIAIRCPDFRHLHTPRILVTATQARGQGRHGLQARVTPLRFTGGALTRLRRGVPYQIQRYFLGEHEFLYLMTFCLPRYLNQDFDQKLVTLFHELYHIGPACDGDLRRHHGRCHIHTHSKRGYDERMAGYAREYLASNPDAELHRFLRLDFAQLQELHGAVMAIVVPRPKMIPLT